MKIPDDFSKFDIADEWAIRSEFWNSKFANSKPKRRKRERNSAPLILCGHGVSLRIESGALLIRDGFTHYPQQQAAYRYFPGDLNLPKRILLLDGSGTLSFEVLSWLAEQDAALARIKWTGEVAIAASGYGYSADRKKVAWQLATQADEQKRFTYALDLIRRKLANSIATLEGCFAGSASAKAAIARARDGMDRMRTIPDQVRGIRAIEGECAAMYFSAWKSLELKWIGTARRPVPEHWHSFKSRSSIATGVKPKNRNASHPVNAMLNYAYAVKLAQLQIQCVADGYDPLIGIMHHERRGVPAFVLDLIEPERPVVDADVLRFIQQRSFSAADFVIRRDGVCRLSPQLARAVAALSTR